MAEITTTALTLKYSTAIAGFLGGVVSLSYVRSLTRWQAMSAIGTGAICAQYLTPIAIHLWTIPLVVHGGVAFLIGLTAINIVPALLKASSLVQDDLTALLKRLLGK